VATPPVSPTQERPCPACGQLNPVDRPVCAHCQARLAAARPGCLVVYAALLASAGLGLALLGVYFFLALVGGGLLKALFGASTALVSGLLALLLANGLWRLRN
jgi:hypothetical protein